MNGWFAEKLLDWYKLNKRDLPWRSEKDPYKIWLSEIILQQTRVTQGLQYYYRFLERFPTINKLAAASENEVMKLWEGLGYYSRARNLHATAKIVAKKFHGKFPGQYREILELKGIGNYTAAAIASFAFKLPYAVVDGNVYRVLSRVFGLKTAIDTTAGKKEFQQLANVLLPKNRADLYNQAIMEFGAQHCKPGTPDCGNCILLQHCEAYAKGWVQKLPVKEKKAQVTERYLHYLLLLDANNKVQIKKRKEKDIWQGLYDFPLLESEVRLKNTQFFSLMEKTLNNKEIKKNLVLVSKEYKHLLSHRTIYARFYLFKPWNTKIDNAKSIPLNKMKNYAFPQLIVKFLRDCELREIV